MQRELVPTFSALGKDFNLEYEGLHLICFGCGKYGHVINHCPDRVVQSTQVVGEVDAQPTQAVGEGVTNQDSPAKIIAPIAPEDIQNLNIPINQQSSESYPEMVGGKEGNIFGPWMIAKKKVWKEQGWSEIRGSK